MCFYVPGCSFAQCTEGGKKKKEKKKQNKKQKTTPTTTKQQTKHEQQTNTHSKDKAFLLESMHRVCHSCLLKSLQTGSACKCVSFYKHFSRNSLSSVCSVVLPLNTFSGCSSSTFEVQDFFMIVSSYFRSPFSLYFVYLVVLYNHNATFCL